MFALLLFGWFGLVWFGLALLGLAVDSWDIRVSKCVCVCVLSGSDYTGENMCALWWLSSAFSEHILRLPFHFNELIITKRRRLCSVMRTQTVAISYASLEQNGNVSFYPTHYSFHHPTNARSSCSSCCYCCGCVWHNVLRRNKEDSFWHYDNDMFVCVPSCPTGVCVCACVRGGWVCIELSLSRALTSPKRFRLLSALSKRHQCQCLRFQATNRCNWQLFGGLNF